MISSAKVKKVHLKLEKMRMDSERKVYLKPLLNWK
jgi:hypothetical protein